MSSLRGNTAAIEQLQRRPLSAADTVILAGAGISLDRPSSFPAGREIVAILARWLGDGDPIQARRAARALSSRGRNPYALIRFEQVWQTLETLMPGISRAMRSLEAFGSANNNHHALAEILANGGGVVTTNFDTRIEQALPPRSTCKPWVFGNSPRVPDVHCRFFKIHGSFGSRPRLLSSLFSIGAAGLGFSRLPNLRAALARLIEGRTLIMVGYSCSDHFDVVPLVEQEWRPARIVWIDYASPSRSPLVALFDRSDDLVIPDIALPFVPAALARFRARLPNIPVFWITHHRVSEVLQALGCCKPAPAAISIETQADALNRTSFEDALEHARWTPTQKRTAIQMLERQDAYGFHASLDTAHDNEWMVLEPDPGSAAPQAPDPGNELFERVAGLVRDGQMEQAAAEIRRTQRRRGMQKSRAILLARALCERARGRLKPAWRLQLLYIDRRNRVEEFWYTHRHHLEDVEVYASLALDYLEQARLQGNGALANAIVAGLDRLFRKSGVIWIGIEVLLAQAQLARHSLNRASDRDFAGAAARVEKAAYYAWRSGRWDLARRATLEFSWYLSIRGDAERSILLLKRLRGICPKDDRDGWVTLTANIALNAALYSDSAVAWRAIRQMRRKISPRRADHWLHVPVCEAAYQLSKGKRRDGRKTLQRAQKKLVKLASDVWGHQACIDAIRRRFAIA